MRKRIRPTVVLTTLLSVLLILCAASIVRQPEASTSGRKLFLSTITSTITEITSTPILPTPTPIDRFPTGSHVAGVDVGGRTREEATMLVEQALEAWMQPLPLLADVRVPDPNAPLLDLAALGLKVDVVSLIEAAMAQASNGQPVDVRWQPEIDLVQLRHAVEALAAPFTQLPSYQIAMTENDPPSITFHTHTYQTLDVVATASLLHEILRDPSQPFTRTAVLRTEQTRGTVQDLEAALRQQLQAWNGVAAIAVHDLETGEWIHVNADTAFSGASVMKVPIMVYAYSRLGALDVQQRAWVEHMIINSSNQTANNLLAAAAGGQGIEAAVAGAHAMSEMLRELGLEYSYQLVPYGAPADLKQRILSSHQAYIKNGAEPLTNADRFMRTTPREMAQFFTMLVQCSQGAGPLLEYRDGAITQDECIEMLGWLGRPHDQGRMVAGVPDDVKVAHKGGWLLDMQSDVGVVFSPNRTYVAAIYLWRDGWVSDGDATPSPYLGALSHTIYSFYNPEPVEGAP